MDQISGAMIYPHYVHNSTSFSLSALAIERGMIRGWSWHPGLPVRRPTPKIYFVHTLSAAGVEGESDLGSYREWNALLPALRLRAYSSSFSIYCLHLNKLTFNLLLFRHLFMLTILYISKSFTKVHNNS